MVGNLEGTLTRVATSTKCAPGAEDCVAFRSPPEYARLFADAGYDVLSLANNHSHDFGAAGLAETRAGGARRSAWPSPAAPDEVAVRTVRGIRVAVVGFAPYGWAAPLNDPAAVRELVVPGRRGGGRGGGRLPRRRRGRGTRCTSRADGRSRSARTAATCAPSPGPRWRPGRTRCSAPARTWCAGAEVVDGRPVAYSVGNLVGYRTLSSAGVTGTTAVLHLTFAADGSWLGGRLHAHPAGAARVRGAGPGAAPRSRWWRGCPGRTSARPPPGSGRTAGSNHPAEAVYRVSAVPPKTAGRWARPAEGPVARRATRAGWTVPPRPAGRGTPRAPCAGASLVLRTGSAPARRTREEAHGQPGEDRGGRRDRRAVPGLVRRRC